MSDITDRVSEYVRNKGIRIKKISTDTGIPYSQLYKSLGARYSDRPLRDFEFMAVCKFLGVNPMDFVGQVEIKA